MQKENRSEKNTTILWLLLIYVSSVIVRYLLALATRNYPTVSIDEFLYYSLGRSIATEGSLLYFGQPAVYNYILYPLILSPVYLLFGHGTNYFRIIELWNIILMSLSVFPFYGLCNAMVRKRKTALWLTGLFMLLPCFILGEFIYSEAIIYPLFFSLMYCVYRYLHDSRVKYTIWIGVLGALLYFSKPGAVLPAVLALAFFAVKAVSGKSGKTGIQVLAGVGSLAIVFIALKLIAEQVFGYQGTFLSVYDSQISFLQTENNVDFFSAIVKYPYYFLLAGGILPVSFSFWRYSEYNKEDKRYFLFVISCSMITMIGIAWFINRPEQKEIIYLRYVEMYLPVLLIYGFIQKDKPESLSSASCNLIPSICYSLLGYIVICTVVWGCTTGVGTIIDAHFLISLSLLFVRNVMGIANIMIVFISGFTLYLLAKKTDYRMMTKISCIILIVVTILNNVVGYDTTAKNTAKGLEDETKEIHRILGDKEYLHIYADDQCDYGLDVNSRRNICRISYRDFFSNIRNNNGIYTPFVPSSVRGMNAERMTPDVDTIIVDEKIYQRIQFSANCTSFISADNSFQIVSLTKGERVADCYISCANYPQLDAGSKCTLTVLNEEWQQKSIRIRLEIESQVDQNMDLYSKGHYQIPLKKGQHWYEFLILEPVEDYTISVQTDSIIIHGFEVKEAE